MHQRALMARRRRNGALAAVILAMLVVLGWGLAGAALTSAQTNDLTVTARRAPVAPDGTTAGAHTDFVVSFADLDPAVPGVPMLVGGTVSIELPAAFVNDGLVPVAATGAEGCGPPGSPFDCSTAVLLQGWPQSVELPFPDVTWDAATNTVTITSTVDWSAVDGPGVKQAHLLLLGFRNPSVAGFYPFTITIQPDPDDPATLSGSGTVEITAQSSASLNPISIINPGPPPPFPNSIYQTVGLGETPLRWGAYLWAADGSAPVGAEIARISAQQYQIVDASGRPIGDVWIDAPAGADGMDIRAVEPATAVGAFVTGIPTALLTSQFTPDATVAGEYVATWTIYDGEPIPLAPGLNEVIYGGANGPLVARLGSIAGAYSVVWHWDNASQTWSFYRPQLPTLSTLTQLEAGKVYWIGVTAPAALATGPQTQVFVRVEE